MIALLLGLSPPAIGADITLPYTQNFDAETPSGGDVDAQTLPAGWVNVSGENTSGTCSASYECYDWLAFTGKAPSGAPIGPNTDHTTGNGNYIYVEDSANGNAEVSLLSPTFNLAGTLAPELSYWTYTFARDFDTFGENKLFIDVMDATGTTALYPEITAQGHINVTDWVKLTVDLSPVRDAGQDLRLRFRWAESGGTTNGRHDIALDDLSIAEGSPTTGQITGTVFTDSNVNGYLSMNETGLSGITVNAYSDTGSLAATDTTGADGNYTLTSLSDGQSYRLEFANAPAGYAPTIAGNTSIQFTTAPRTLVNAGFQQPAQFCSTNSRLAVSRFTNGDALGAGSESALMGSIITSNYEVSAGLNKKNLAVAQDTGAIWGLAYEPVANDLYGAAFVRRHAGLGPDGIGAIYRWTDADVPTSLSTFYDFGALAGTISSNSSRGLPGDPMLPNHDVEAYAKVGKTGLGDIDVSSDGSTLWVVVPAQQNLYSVSTNSPAAGTATAAPTPPWLTANPCTNGQPRPWAIEIHNNGSGEKIYVGVTCDASTGTNTDIQALVYNYTPGGSWSTVLLTAGFDYGRAPNVGNDVDGRQWHPWTDTFPGTNQRPTPLLSDMEIDDDGFITLAIMDRWAMQNGADNYIPNTTDSTTLFTTYNGGELLIASPDGDGTFTLESNGVADTRTSTGPSSEPIVGGGTLATLGPGGREFYYNENYLNIPGNIGHHETALGSLAQLPGSGSLIATVMDPLVTESGGHIQINPTDGSGVGHSQIYRGNLNFGDLGTFGKNAGLGDVEWLCPQQPIEIGNRVWLDSDNDGIQHSSESGIKDVTVTLHDNNGTLLATTLTDASGEYYFNDNNVSVRLQPATPYEIRIALSQSAVSTYALTTENVNSGSSLPDGVDSDGVAINANGNAVITLTTNQAGENNHSFDFGFAKRVDIELTKTVAPTTALRGGTVVYTLTVSNTSANDATGIQATDRLPFELSYVSDDGAGDYNSNTGVWDIGNLAAGASKMLNITMTVK